MVLNLMAIIVITYIIFCLIFHIFIMNKGFSSKIRKFKVEEMEINGIRVGGKEIGDYINDYYYNYNPYIQFDPNCSEYDSELFYKMKRGKCRFRKTDFSVVYNNNFLGLRDEKEDLKDVRVIITGDSFTLGYGVGQDQTISSFVEGFTGKEVLNAGISSYGTAREAILLDRILKSQKLDKLEYIAIQYCNNDYLENDQYVKNGYKLSIGPEFSKGKKGGGFNVMEDLISPVHNIAYDDIVKSSNRFGDDWSVKRIFYGNIVIILKQLRILQQNDHIAQSAGGNGYVIDKEKRYEFFLNILQKKIVNNPFVKKHVKFILFDVEPWNEPDHFYKKINELLKKKQYSKLRDRVLIIDTHKILNVKEDFFKNDIHTNSNGNKKIAREISEYTK